MYIVEVDVDMIAIFAQLAGEQFLPKVMSCVGEVMTSARVSIHPAVQTDKCRLDRRFFLVEIDGIV
jgi:hypothetical protein